MSVTMNCAQTSSVTPNFKGKWSKTEKGNPYYETNNGVKVGAVWSGINTIGFLKKNGRTGIGLAAICARIVAGVGCGAVYDYLRNKKAQEADYIQNAGVEKALETRNDLAISSNRKVYYDNVSGAKDGAIIGALAGIPLGILGTLHSAKVQKEILNNPMNTAQKVVSILVSVPFYALGGYIMGKIANHYTNKNAEKNA